MKKFTNQNILFCRLMTIINNGKALLGLFLKGRAKEKGGRQKAE